jgi:DMSO/TMAO reductase YedYZ molybdopterin-dependent catalytic subunit
MRAALPLLLCAVLIALAPVIAAAADQPSLSIEGHVRHPQKFDLETLRELPAETVQVSFEGERAAQNSSFTGVRLWTLLDKAGGIDDSAKGAELRHVIKVSGRDGYIVVISTGEIAPEFGGKPALIAYQRDGAMLGEAGFRLVMPGDKRGGRNVRDVVTIAVE